MGTACAGSTVVGAADNDQNVEASDEKCEEREHCPSEAGTSVRALAAMLPTLHLSSPQGKSVFSLPQLGVDFDAESLFSPRSESSLASPTMTTTGNPMMSTLQVDGEDALSPFINQMVEHSWPYISDFCFNVVGKTVEPAIKMAMGKMGNKFAFDLKSCSLGCKPARFSEVKTHRAEQVVADGKLDNIVIKGKVNWEGDVKIITRFGSVPMGVKRVKVSGDGVVECVGMLPRPPFFMGCRVFFLNPPKVELEFRGWLASVLAVRPLKKQVMKELERQFSNNFVVPNRLGVRVDQQSEIFRIKCPRPQGILRLRVVRAEHLLPMDTSWRSRRAESSDPYVVVRCGAERFRSATVQQSLFPEFGFEVRLPIMCAQHQVLHIDVWDADLVKKDDFLGTVDIGVGEIIQKVSESGEGAAWLGLLDKKGRCDKGRGRVLVAAEWRPLTLDAHASSPDDAAQVFAGVYSASQLPGLPEGTRYWVAGSCTHLATGRTTDPPHQLTQPDGRMRTTQMRRQPDPMMADTDEAAAHRARLQRRLEILQERGVPCDEIAEVLGVDEQTVRRHAGGDAHARDVQATERHSVMWNQGFYFLVSDAKQAVLTLDIRYAEPGNGLPGTSLGTVSARVADLLDKQACTSVETLAVPGSDITLKARLQVRHLGPAEDASGQCS